MQSTISLTPGRLISCIVRALAPVCKLMIFGFAMLLFGLYIAFCPLVSKSFWDKALFPFCWHQKGPYPPCQIRQIGAQDCWFVAPSGHKVHGWFFEKPGAKFTALVHHGQGGNVSTYGSFAELMLVVNCSVLEYDYEGYGRSEGEPGLEEIIADGTAAYQYLISEKHIPANRIVHLGISLGTGVACNIAKDHPAAGVILMSPYSSLLAVGKARFPFLNWYPRWTIPYRDIETLSFARHKLHPPVLMYHGCNDAVIPVEQADKLAAAAAPACTYVRFDKAEHTNFLDQKHINRTFDELTKFMEKLDKSPRG
jgi:pimeloyl-ACP methyl ester carboxylesterase